MLLLSLFGKNAARATLAILFLSLAGWSGLAEAQARSTADRSYGLAAYAGGSYAQTDYNSHDKGYTAGADLSTTFHHFEPAIDVRYTMVTGSVVDQRSFAGGLKLQRKVGPIRPYADVEVGMGTIFFNFAAGNTASGAPYTHDSSMIKAFGGGVDIRVARWIDFKADAQYQYWKPNEKYLTPVVSTIGIAYRIPYRSLTRR